MASDADPTRYKYPLPIDPFTVLTILVPGAALFFSLPHDAMSEAVGATVLGNALRGPDHWYHYPALVVVLFLVGVTLDAGGRMGRAGLARAIARWRGPKTSALLLEQLREVLALKRAQADATTRVTATSGVDGSELHMWITELTVMAAQVPRGKAFRMQDRTLAMLTNLTVAVAVAVVWSPMAGAAGLGRRAAIGLVAVLALSSGFVLWRWWTELMFAASGVDLVSFHETQRLEAERRHAESEESIQTRMRAFADREAANIRAIAEREVADVRKLHSTEVELRQQVQRSYDETAERATEAEKLLAESRAQVESAKNETDNLRKELAQIENLREALQARTRSAVQLDDAAGDFFRALDADDVTVEKLRYDSALFRGRFEAYVADAVGSRLRPTVMPPERPVAKPPPGRDDRT